MNNDDAYLRKDTFDETMKRIEAMIAASEARHREYSTRQDARNAAQIIEGYGDTLAAYVQSFSARSSFWQGVLGVVVGGCAIVVAAVQVYLALRG